MTDNTADGTDPGAELDARLAARLAALSAPPGGAEADAVAAERERIRQLAIRTRAVTVSETGRMLPFEELLRHSPEENAALLLEVADPARAAPCGCLNDFEHGPLCGPAMPAAAPPRPHDFSCHADERIHAEDCECWCHLNDGRPAIWSGACAPGGYVCAMPDDLTADGICGNPVESEPCNRHGPQALSPAEEALQAPRPVVRVLPEQDTPAADRLLCDNPGVMDSLMRALCDPGQFVPRAPLESLQSWQRRAVIEHAAPLIAAAERDRYRDLAVKDALAEVRRIAYQGGQDAASVRRELLAYLEDHNG